jgi:hypothetical protein
MTQLFLAPATDRGEAYGFFFRTMLEGVSKEVFRQSSDLELERIVHVWGLMSSMRGEWETVEAGDWVLFYTRSGQYEYAAQVEGKEHNPELGDELRLSVLEADDEQGRDWDYLLFFLEPVSVDISGSEVAELFEYGNDYPVRFIRVTEERMRGLEREYGDVESFVEAVKE